MIVISNFFHNIIITLDFYAIHLNLLTFDIPYYYFSKSISLK